MENWLETCRPGNELEPSLWADHRISQTLASFERTRVRTLNKRGDKWSRHCNCLSKQLSVINTQIISTLVMLVELGPGGHMDPRQSQANSAHGCMVNCTWLVRLSICVPFIKLEICGKRSIFSYSISHFSLYIPCLKFILCTHHLIPGIC